jgi:hypothetical protein
MPLTELVGRERETAQVAGLLAEKRLVTLTGPGGIGKTRLSLAVAAMVADTFGDGAVFVPLAEATTVDTAVSALARALGVAEVGGQPLADTVIEHLAEKSTLLRTTGASQRRAGGHWWARSRRRGWAGSSASTPTCAPLWAGRWAPATRLDQLVDEVLALDPASFAGPAQP